MSTPERDPFEDRLRDALHNGLGPTPEPERFIADVHRGALHRRRRQVGGTVAAVLLVVGGGFAVVQTVLPSGGNAPTAADPSNGSDTPSTLGQPSSTSPTTPSATPGAAEDLIGVLSATATGTDAQWALAASRSDHCKPRPDQACAVVLGKGVGANDWTALAALDVPTPRSPAKASTSTRYQVSQLRFAGSATAGYDGWAFGGGLWSTHGDSGGTEWNPVNAPTPGAVTQLEAHGDTVYAVFDDAGSSLFRSPTSSDDFEPVDVGLPLGSVTNLVVDEAGVAFVNAVGGQSEVVTSTDGSAWTASLPCAQGEPTSLSGAGAALWAICATPERATVWTADLGSATWRREGASYDVSSLVAARSDASAVVAQPSGLWAVGDGAGRLAGLDLSRAAVFGFTNPEAGLAVDDGALFRTQDGGQTWAREDVSP